MRMVLVPLCLVLGLGGCQMRPPYTGDSSKHAALVRPGDAAVNVPGGTPVLRHLSEMSIGRPDLSGPSLPLLEPGFGPPDIPTPAHPPEPPADRPGDSLIDGFAE